jgi:hypothetical protein
MIGTDTVLHLSRIRSALVKEGRNVDLKRATQDAKYLNEVLVAASNHSSSEVQESAFLLGARFKLNGPPMGGVSLLTPGALSMAMQAESDSLSMALHQERVGILPEITSDRPEYVEPGQIDDLDPAPNSILALEPAGFAFSEERRAVLNKYVGGLR